MTESSAPATPATATGTNSPTPASAGSTGASSAGGAPSNGSGGRGAGRGGRGRGRGGRGSRGRGRDNTAKQNKKQQKKFLGETSEMNGHVFQTFAETDDRKQWTKTLEAIGRYINLKMTNSSDLAPVHRELKLPIIPEPEAPDAKLNLDKDHPEMYKWRKKFDRCLVKQEKLEDNLRSIYSLVWGQCSTGMQAKVQSIDGYELADRKCDCIWLLTQIKGVMFKFEGQKEIFHAHTEANSRLETFKQKDGESANSFMEQYSAIVEAYEHYGGSIGNAKGLVAAIKSEMKDKDPGEYNTSTKDADVIRAWIRKDREFTKLVLKTSRDRTLAMQFLHKSDRTKYGELWLNLQNRYSMGYNEFPKNLSEAYTLVTNFKPEKQDRKPRKHKDKKGGEGTKPTDGDATTPSEAAEEEVEVNFLQGQMGEPVSGTDGVTYPDIECYNCHFGGHYAHQCPTRDTPRKSSVKFASSSIPKATVPITREVADVGTSLLQAGTQKKKDDDFKIEIMFHQGYHNIPEHWILLDSQSTTCVFRNKAFLTNIRKSDKILHLITNGGTHTSTLIGDLGNFGSVWFNENSLANILSLAAVRRKCRVTMDTAERQP